MGLALKGRPGFSRGRKPPEQVEYKKSPERATGILEYANGFCRPFRAAYLKNFIRGFRFAPPPAKSLPAASGLNKNNFTHKFWSGRCHAYLNVAGKNAWYD